jgi:hypothetical protein
MSTAPKDSRGKTRKVNPLVRAVVWIFPPIYKLYMHFVFLTSKRVFYNYISILTRKHHDVGILAAIWHQGVLLQPFTFRNFDVVTMVSKSDFGEIMALIARRMGFTPVRGSSSMAGREALSEVIDYVRTHPKIFFGLTVDGSRGPAYKVKMGIIVIASESGVPIYPVQATAKRKKLLRTWDKTLLPLPFNEFAYFFGDPVVVPEGLSRDEMEAKRQELEDALMRLKKRADEHFEKGRPTAHPDESISVHTWTDKAGQDALPDEADEADPRSNPSATDS